MDSHFTMKWYSFLCKITGKHAYSIPTSQRVYSDNGRLVLKVIEIYAIFYCHFIFKILYLNQNCDCGEPSLTSNCLPAELLGLSWIFKNLSFSQKIKCINVSSKINGLSSIQWIKRICYLWNLTSTKTYHHSTFQITLS